MLAEFSINPMGELHMSDEIAKAVETLQQHEVPYRIGPMGTSIEGEWDAIMKAVRACHEQIARDSPRVITTITIDDRRDGGHHLDEMVPLVEQELTAKAVEPLET